MREWECVVEMGQVWARGRVSYTVIGVRNIDKRYDKEIHLTYKKGLDKNGHEIIDTTSFLASTLCSDPEWQRINVAPKRTTTLMGVPAPLV